MLKAIYTNKTDYSETKTWEVQVFSFLVPSPQDMLIKHGTLTPKPCGVCVFEDGHIEVVPIENLKVAPVSDNKPVALEWFDPAPAPTTQVQDNDEPPICATVSAVEDISLTLQVPHAPHVVLTRDAFRRGVQWAHNNLHAMDSPMLADTIAQAAKDAYPGDKWERHVVQTGYKSGTTHAEVWPDGEGWEIDVDRGFVGTPDAGWDRFNHHEELYFRRRRTGKD